MDLDFTLIISQNMRVGHLAMIQIGQIRSKFYKFQKEDKKHETD